MDHFQPLYKLSADEPKKWKQQIYFKRPQIIGIQENVDDQLGTPKNLRYFKSPPLSSYPLDLNDGFENYTFRNESFYRTSLNKIEKFVMDNECSESHIGTKELCKIYTTRSVLYRVMLTPYRLRQSEINNFTVCASKFKDSIWLSQPEQHTNRHEHSRNDTYHFKFEQYCFSDSPATEPITDVPIDENKQTYCIFRSQLKDFDITYSAEINGVDSEREIKDLTNLDELNQCRFVLTKLLYDSSYLWRSHPKVLNWWIQSYLSKTDDIYFGFKNQNGKVCVPIEHTAVKDIPKNQKWQPNVCVAFLHNFLKMVKHQMKAVDCPYTVYEFQYVSGQMAVNCRKHEGRTEFSFLSDRFIDHLQKQRV